jgi:hypothetical protein
VLGWPKICKLDHAFLWEYSHKRPKLAKLLGQLGVFLTLRASVWFSPLYCIGSAKEVTSDHQRLSGDHSPERFSRW